MPLGHILSKLDNNLLIGKMNQTTLPPRDGIPI